MTAPPRREWGALIAILVAAAAIRGALAGFPLWFDELASLFFAHQPLANLWSGWMARESNPPLYYTLLGGWTVLFGDGDRVARALSIFIGLGGIVAIWAVARRIGGAFAGLAAAALLAVSAAHVATSLEARGYILAATAVMIAVLGMVDFLERRRPAGLALYALGAVVALYSHTAMVVFVGLAGATMLWLIRRDRRAIVAWLAINAGVALCWAWWGWISLAQLGGAKSNFDWIAPVTPASAVETTEIAYLPTYLATAGFAGHLLLLALAGMIVILAWRDRRPAIILLAALALGAPVALMILSLITPILLPRTLYWASGPVVVLVAVALVTLSSRRVAITGLGLLLAFEAALLAHWAPARQHEDWPGAMRAIAKADPRGTLLVEGDAMAIAASHYQAQAPGARIVALRHPPDASDQWGEGQFAGPHVDAAGARALLTHKRQLFVLVRGDHDPGVALSAVGQGREVTDRQPWLWIWRDRREAR